MDDDSDAFENEVDNANEALASIIEILLDNSCSCGIQTGDLFDRSTTASYCCDANRGHFDDWAPTMGDKSDAFEREADKSNETLASKLAVITFMECEPRMDDRLDRELMSKLALVSSFEEGRDEVVEGLDDGGGVDSKLAVILLPFIGVDADVDMEVFVTLEVAMVAAAAAAAAEAAAAMAAAAVTLRAARIFVCLLIIFPPSK